MPDTSFFRRNKARNVIKSVMNPDMYITLLWISIYLQTDVDITEIY